MGLWKGKPQMAENDTPITDRALVAHDLLDEIEQARLEGRDQAAIDALVAEYRELRQEL